MGWIGPKGEDIPPHPRQEPRFEGDLTADHIRFIFRDCADFGEREVLIGGDPEKRTCAARSGAAASGCAPENISFASKAVTLSNSTQALSGSAARSSARPHSTVLKPQPARSSRWRAMRARSSPSTGSIVAQ